MLFKFWEGRGAIRDPMSDVGVTVFPQQIHPNEGEQYGLLKSRLLVAVLPCTMENSLVPAVGLVPAEDRLISYIRPSAFQASVGFIPAEPQLVSYIRPSAFQASVGRGRDRPYGRPPAQIRT